MPRFEDREFPAEGRRNKFQIVASAAGTDGEPDIAQDAAVLVAAVEPDTVVEQAIGEGRHFWLQLARGAIELNGLLLEAGDGAAGAEEGKLKIKGREQADLILFDLA